jgi:hypothetical protein
MAKS